MHSVISGYFNFHWSCGIDDNYFNSFIDFTSHWN